MFGIRRDRIGSTERAGIRQNDGLIHMKMQRIGHRVKRINILIQCGYYEQVANIPQIWSEL